MCSINHNLKAIYIHIPKNGGLYISEILEKFYNFNTYYFTAENHIDYLDLDYQNLNKNNQIHNYKGFLNIRKKGILRYYKNSKKFNKLADMNDDKWNSYFKFTFTRNPFTKCISAYNYLKKYNKNILTLNEVLQNTLSLSNYEYFHLIIPQYEQLINNENNIDFNFIGHFDNLNEDLIIALSKIGILNIKHRYYLENNIVINSNSVQDNLEINEETIKLINEIFKDDFDKFKYNYVNINDYKQILIDEKNIIKKNKKVLDILNIN